MTSRFSLLSRLTTLALVSLAFLATAASASAQTGKLSGRVVDQDGQPLISASVLVVGTTYGAATDLDGVYNILRIPPGTVSVRVSSIGYQTQLIEGVQMASNTTTTLNVTLVDETVRGEEVVVTADQPIVDVTQTSTLATIGRDEIAALPVQELGDVVNLQAGVVDGHFRGGRIGEVQFQVDGVSVNNPYDNTSTLTLDRSVLQEVQVISGTFDAEYGQALSGVLSEYLRSHRVEPDLFEAISVIEHDDILWVPRRDLEAWRVVTNGIYDERAEYINVNGDIALRLSQIAITGDSFLTLFCTDFLVLLNVPGCLGMRVLRDQRRKIQTAAAAPRDDNIH